MLLFIILYFIFNYLQIIDLFRQQSLKLILITEMQGISSELTQSLQIVENANRISLGSGQFDHVDNDYDNRDILEYSQDQPSINFVVEDQKQEIPFEKILDVKQQPEKKKRRDIFGKYKKKTQQQVHEPVRNSGGFMKTFDQVFHLGEFSSKIQQQKNFQKKKSPQQGNATISENSDSVIIQQNRDTICIDRISLLNNSDLKMGDESWIRFSAIKENAIGNETHEEKDIQQLLKIIQEDRQTTPVKKQEKSQPLITSPQIETNSKRIMITKQENIQSSIHSIHSNNTEKQSQQLGGGNSISSEPSSTQLYNQIDITESMPNSMISKDPLMDISQNKKITLSPSGSKNNLEKLSPLQHSKQNRYIPALVNKAVFPMARLQQYDSYPIFIRQVCKINQTYPNFKLPNFQPNSPQHKQQIIQLIGALRNILDFLGKISKEIVEKCARIRQHLLIFKNGYKLDHFLNSGWEKTIQIEGIDKIRPKKSFTTRTFDYAKISKALQNYRQIVQYYKSPNLKLATEQGRKKYMSLRNKIWDIQKNIILISEDLYSETLRYIYPLHYHEFFLFLKSSFPKHYSKTIIDQRKYLMAKYLYMKNKNDALSCSQVGLEVRKKLQIQLKYLCPI